MLPSRSFGDRPFDMQERQQVLVHADQYSTPNWLLKIPCDHLFTLEGLGENEDRGTPGTCQNQKKKHGFKPQIVEKQINKKRSIPH